MSTSAAHHTTTDSLNGPLAIAPTADPRRIIEIQIDQERERLARMAEKLKQGKMQSADLVDQLVEDWLPFLAKQLSGR